MDIFISGDTHGDFRRFGTNIFYEQKELTKKDIVLICGDFGGVWGGSPSECCWLNRLSGLNKGRRYPMVQNSGTR